jgi:cyclopropane fatty-acyl-phospholipid synthase-like methyltransferase
MRYKGYRQLRRASFNPRSNGRSPFPSAYAAVPVHTKAIQRIFGGRRRVKLFNRPGFGVKDVERFYDQYTPRFLETYGEVFQAYLDPADTNFLDGLVKAIGIEDGMRLIDAGCGVCGPAMHFAEGNDVTIDALTLSRVQVEHAQSRVEEAGLGDRVRVHEGDFHNLASMFDEGSFDLVYFLESLGHACSLATVIDAVRRVLRPEGVLYLREYFQAPVTTDERKRILDGFTRAVSREYRYMPLRLEETVKLLRKNGFLIDFIRIPELPEDYARSLEFESKTGLSVYTRAVQKSFRLFEFLEIRCRKLA